jgi:hypothetical protein
MIIVKKRRGQPVVFLLIAVNVFLVGLSAFILLSPSRRSRARSDLKAMVTLTDTSPHTHIQAPATSTAPGENEAFLTMRVEQVYAHNATRLYYTEGCRQRPQKAYKIARSLAIKQGFTLAPNCSD